MTSLVGSSDIRNESQTVFETQEKHIALLVVISCILIGIGRLVAVTRASVVINIAMNMPFGFPISVWFICRTYGTHESHIQVSGSSRGIMWSTRILAFSEEKRKKGGHP